MKNKVVIHGPFQDDIDYSNLIKSQSSQNIDRISIPLEQKKSKCLKKVKKISRK